MNLQTEAQRRLPIPKEGTGLHTIAFDLDGTLAEATWPSPKIGKPIQRAIDAACEYRAKGYELIIFTSRPKSHLEDIVFWLQENGLEDIFYDIVTGKPRAAMYVDDRAVTFPEAFRDECNCTDGRCHRRTSRRIGPLAGCAACEAGTVC